MLIAAEADTLHEASFERVQTDVNLAFFELIKEKKKREKFA